MLDSIDQIGVEFESKFDLHKLTYWPQLINCHGKISLFISARLSAVATRIRNEFVTCQFQIE